MSSTFEEMERVEPFVEELGEWAELREEDFNRVMLALSEAVNNAIMHGNEQDPDKNAYINASLDNRILTIRVRDEGEGFDPEEVPDPLKEENLLNQGGRGIYLIEQYADEVEYSESGSEVTIIFELQS